MELPAEMESHERRIALEVARQVKAVTAASRPVTAEKPTGIGRLRAPLPDNT